MTLANITKKDRSVYGEGCRAFRNGLRNCDNPYDYDPHPNSDFMQWRNGFFNTAQLERTLAIK